MVWTPWPDVHGNDAVAEKSAQKLECLSCGVCWHPILLKPAVPLFHLLQGNKLSYDIAVHLSRNSGRKKNWSDDPILGDGAPNAELFRMKADFLIQVGVFTAPHSKIPLVDVACPVKPGLIAEKDVIERSDSSTIGIEEPDDSVAEVHTLARIWWQPLLNQCCAIQAQFQFFKCTECGRR